MSLAGYALIALAPPAAVAADGNGSAVKVTAYSGEARLILSSGAGAASTTLAVKLQHSDDGTTNWTDAGFAFAPVTTTASHQVVGVNVDKFKAFVRVVDDVTGTSPSFARGVFLLAKEDRSAPSAAGEPGGEI